MKNRLTLIMVIALTSLLMFSCASHKGSSSLRGSKSKTTATTYKPKPKSKPTIKPEVEKAPAEPILHEATVVEEPQQPVAEEKPIVMKEEKVTMVQSSASASKGSYHVIIGSFKVLENARTASEQSVKEGFLPSIMENEDGLYRVAVFSGNEKTARTKIAEIRGKYSKYSDVWLLVERK